MRMRMQHAVHRGMVLLKGSGRGRATARIVMGRRDDGRVPRMRRGHSGRLVRTAAMRMHRLVVGGRGGRCRGSGRCRERLHVESSGVRLVRMMVRMMTGVVHAHRGRPVIAARLQAHPGIRRREARRRMRQSVRRRRRCHLMMVMMVVMMLRRRHVLHLPGIGGATRRARGVATYGDVHPDRCTRTTIQLGRHCATNRHVRGSGHLLPLVQRFRLSFLLPSFLSVFPIFLSILPMFPVFSILLPPSLAVSLRAALTGHPRLLPFLSSLPSTYLVVLSSLCFSSLSSVFTHPTRSVVLLLPGCWLTVDGCVSRKIRHAAISSVHRRCAYDRAKSRAKISHKRST